MNLDRARVLYARSSASPEHRDDPSGLAEITERFHSGSNADRVEIHELFARFLAEGDELEARIACSFFSNQPPPSAVVASLVAALRDADEPRRAQLERTLGSSATVLSPEDREELEALFRADPRRHLALAGNLMRRGCAIWEVFARAVRGLDELDALLVAHEAASIVDRERDFFALLADHPRELLEALAPMLPSGCGELLLGLSAG